MVFPISVSIKPRRVGNLAEFSHDCTQIFSDVIADDVNHFFQVIPSDDDYSQDTNLPSSSTPSTNKELQMDSLNRQNGSQKRFRQASSGKSYHDSMQLETRPSSSVSAANDQSLTSEVEKNRIPMNWSKKSVTLEACLYDTSSEKHTVSMAHQGQASELQVISTKPLIATPILSGTLHVAPPPKHRHRSEIDAFIEYMSTSSIIPGNLLLPTLEDC